jgi:hypothetical protein
MRYRWLWLLVVLWLDELLVGTPPDQRDAKAQVR